MDLEEMRGRVRADLRDPSAERWDDEVLGRHIERAVRELSLAAPREATAQLATTEGARDLSLAGLTDRVSVEAVEYPVGQYPPAFVAHSTWGTR